MLTECSAQRGLIGPGERVQPVALTDTGSPLAPTGQLVLRAVLPIWGFFAGFALGAGIFAELADERFLGTVLGWVTGLVFALIFAVFAYLYYAVAVLRKSLTGLERGLAPTR